MHYGNKYSIKSIERIFVAGEHCDYETKSWVQKVFQVPVLNHWWQTETGHAITGTCVGLGQSLYPPKYTTGMPFPGYDGMYTILILFLTLSTITQLLPCYKPVVSNSIIMLFAGRI